MTIHKILFPVDFSEGSRAVAPFVLSMALRHKASVVLMNVIQPPGPIYGGAVSGGMSGGIDALYPAEPFDYAEVRGILTNNLNEFAAAELPKVQITSVVDVGDPAFAIVDYAHEAANGIDLIAMPTHGYGAFRRALLGSVTAKVLHDARMPVWMSAHAPDPSHRAHPQPRHIVVAIDPDQRARETLDAAMAMAKETEATVDIVTAVSEGMIAPGMADEDLDGLLIGGTRELLAKLQFEAGTGAGMVIEIGGPAKVVRDAALAKRADLVVVGRSEVHGILGRFRENSYSIIREAPCPVLSL
jgi:nucleotide-binding universal stress UspA family protein